MCEINLLVLEPTLKRRIAHPARLRQGWVALAAAALLAGCQAGPEFVRPAPPSVHGYVPGSTPTALDAGRGEPAQRLVGGQAIPAAWWELFHSAALDRTVHQAIADNPSIGAARASLAQAQQAVLQSRGADYPQLDLAAAAERQRGPASILGQQPGHSLPLYNLYTVGPIASFSPDVFGANARRVEEQASLAQYRAFELAAAQLTVSGDVVTEAVTAASLRAQIEAVQEIVAGDDQNLALVQRKYAAGRTARSDVLIAQSQLSNDRALLPPLRQQLAAAEDALTILTGSFPSQGAPAAFALSDFELPADLPLAVPSALVHQRPDILAAEAQLHAASAAIGVAAAQLYPNITLSASLESAALTPGSLFESSGTVWSLLGGLTAPIFHGGALRAQKQEAVEAFNATYSTYRQTVLQAFGQVADTLRALGHDARLVADEHQALEIAQASLSLQRAGYAAGRTDVLHLLDAQRSYEQARMGYARAVAQRDLDSAQLLVAMGGGWTEDRALCTDCKDGERVTN
jgi:NodT family efflux transporter outer membrane factor (OMF) lipoprotein